MKTVQHHSSLESTHASSHGSVKSYVIGFVLSMILTLASFGVVMKGLVPHSMMLVAIVVLCVAQLLIQLVCFLHIGTAPDQRAKAVIGQQACRADTSEAVGGAFHEDNKSVALQNEVGVNFCCRQNVDASRGEAFKLLLDHIL